MITGILFSILLAAGGAAPAETVSISVSRRIVVYGERVAVTGTSSSRESSEGVVLLARPYGRGFRAVAQVAVDERTGQWTARVRPTIRTALQARIGEETSGIVTVSVRPRVSLLRRGRAFLARVVAGRSFEGSAVLLQRRLSTGRWKTVRRAILRRVPLRFEVELPPGRSLVRALLPARQAGPGYLRGFSKPVVVRR